MQFFAAIIVGVTVAACSDENPTVPSVTPQFVLAPGDALVCDFPDANKANRDYFANRSQSRTDVKEFLGDMNSAGAGTIDADSIGFEIFKTIEEQTPTGSDVQGGPAEGSELTNQVLACMAPAMTPGDTAVDFTGAFGPSGAFCVRGGSGDLGSECLTYDGLSGLTPNPNPNTQSTKSDWESWFNERRLVYAEPLPTFASAEMVQPVTVSIEAFAWRIKRIRIGCNTTKRAQPQRSSCCLTRRFFRASVALPHCHEILVRHCLGSRRVCWIGQFQGPCSQRQLSEGEGRVEGSTISVTLPWSMLRP
jgi:hypothetical protein